MHAKMLVETGPEAVQKAESWGADDILIKGEYPINFEFDLALDKHERSMFFSITGDHYLHFLFYFCVLHQNKEDILQKAAQVLCFPLGLADRPSLNTFFTLFLKIRLAVGGHMFVRD